MASLKYSGFGITDMAGAVGGNIVQRNKSGAFIKKNTAHSKRRTASQVQQQLDFSYISGLWRQLSDQQRAAWKAAASSGQWPRVDRLGEVGVYSGFQLFSELNGNLRTIGAPMLFVPPLKKSVPNSIEAITSMSISAEMLSINIGISLSEGTLSVFATAPLGIGIASPAFFKLVKTTDISDQSANYSAYASLFGPGTENAYYWLDVYYTISTSGQKFNIHKIRGLISA